MGMVKAVVSLIVAALASRRTTLPVCLSTTRMTQVVRLYVLTIYQQILTTTDTAP